MAKKKKELTPEEEQALQEQLEREAEEARIKKEESDKKRAEVREEIYSLLDQVNTEGIDRLKDDLDELGYFYAPASTRYHLNEEGGLAEHSLNVAKTMLQLADTFNAYDYTGVTTSSLIVCGLFHDLAKAKWKGNPYYKENILKTTKARSDKKPWVTNKNRPKAEHSILSVYMLSEYLELTDHEIEAIMYHDGSYTNIWRSYMSSEKPLWFIMHTADMWNARFLESGEFDDDLSMFMFGED